MSIQMTNFDFVFRPFSGREEHIPAMQRVKRITEDYSVRFQGHVFPWARIFASWETDEVINLTSWFHHHSSFLFVFIFFSTS